MSLPHNEPPSPHVFPGNSPRITGRANPDSCESFCFVLRPSAHENLCVPFKSGVCISPRPVELLSTSSAGPQYQMLRGLLLPMPDPQAGEPDMGSELSLPWVSLCDIVTFQSVIHLLDGYEVAYMGNCPPTTISQCGFLFVFWSMISFLTVCSLFC